MFVRGTLILLVLVANTTHALASDKQITSQNPTDQKDRTVSALVKTISYMRSNYDKLNLDAITGLRIIQGIHCYSWLQDTGDKSS